MAESLLCFMMCFSVKTVLDKSIAIFARNSLPGKDTSRGADCGPRRGACGGAERKLHSDRSPAKRVRVEAAQRPYFVRAAPRMTLFIQARGSCTSSAWGAEEPVMAEYITELPAPEPETMTRT